MPIYEYECRACSKQFTVLILKVSEEDGLACPECSGTELLKLISRCAYHMSEGGRLATYDEKKKHGLDFYKDSRNIGLHAQKMANKMGVDLGEQFQNTLERARSGKILDDYET